MTECMRWRAKNMDMFAHRFSKNEYLTSAGWRYIYDSQIIVSRLRVILRSLMPVMECT